MDIDVKIYGSETYEAQKVDKPVMHFHMLTWDPDGMPRGAYARVSPGVVVPSAQYQIRLNSTAVSGTNHLVCAYQTKARGAPDWKPLSETMTKPKVVDFETPRGRACILLELSGHIAKLRGHTFVNISGFDPDARSLVCPCSKVLDDRDIRQGCFICWWCERRHPIEGRT